MPSLAKAVHRLNLAAPPPFPLAGSLQAPRADLRSNPKKNPAAAEKRHTGLEGDCCGADPAQPA